MKTLLGIVCSLLFSAADAENLIINRSVTSGRIDLGPNAQTGSIVIDGKAVTNSRSEPSSQADADAVKREVARRLEATRQKLLRQSPGSRSD